VKRFLLKIGLVGVIFIGLNLLYLKLAQKLDWNLSKCIEIYDFENRGYECLVLGNSMVLDGIDTQFLTEQGISSYNMGLGGANLQTTLTQLEHYLTSNTAPEVALLGLAPDTFHQFNFNDIHPIVDHVYLNRGGVSIKDLPMIKLRWMGREMLKLMVSKDHRNVEIVAGQLRLDRNTPDGTSYPEEMTDTLDPGKYLRSAYLAQIDSVCRAHGTELIILEMPGFKEKQNLIPVGPLAIDRDDGKSYELYNLNNKELIVNLFDEEEDWLSMDHLNVKGARILSEYIYLEILQPRI
jgi:hypothetical protein